MLDQFGSFASVFAAAELPVPGHLTLLNPEADAQIMLARLERARAQPDARFGLRAMFRDTNWRPHLVACVTLLLEPSGSVEPSLLDALWETLNAGSWVSPQLVVVASLLDPAFADRSGARLRAGCPISTPRLTAAQRHHAMGPGIDVLRSGKEAGALIAMRQQLDPPLLQPATNDPRLDELLQTADDGGALAVAWRRAIETQIVAYRSGNAPDST